MSRLDRQFAEMRANALKRPMTRATRPVIPEIDLPGGMLIGLSFNL